ncbi:hypothetical protein [Nonomuraea angiospora]|uniref:hypothetical protein n=1 Tax=Nonomuraea angiospora TaxID=46172 RepID=UPI0029B7DD84|nr:hypothetical protein [Nonomuraea angiospora]MDX3106061.1 hypothetical protein [Nonomuraea angiospora]
MITLEQVDLGVLFFVLVVTGVACFLLGLSAGAAQDTNGNARAAGNLHKRLPALLGKPKLRLILDHHWQIERLTTERDDARQIVSTQLAEIGKLSQQLQHLGSELAIATATTATAENAAAVLQSQLSRAYRERDTAGNRLELLITGTTGLAESWERLGQVPTRLPYAARELRDLLQQLGMTAAPLGGDAG